VLTSGGLKGWSVLKACEAGVLRRANGGATVEDRINYFERMLADNPDNPTGLLALANEYGKVERYEAAG
jgi:hypothetical protein